MSIALQAASFKLVCNSQKPRELWRRVLFVCEVVARQSEGSQSRLTYLRLAGVAAMTQTNGVGGTGVGGTRRDIVFVVMTVLNVLYTYVTVPVQ